MIVSGHRDGGAGVVAGLLGAGQTEVQQLDAVWREKDVRWLQVAMHDPSRVDRGECREHRERDIAAVGQRNWPAGEARGERLALEQLHREEELAVCFADFVQLAHVRMRHAGGRPCLAPEALSRFRILAGAAYHLDGHLTVEALVRGGIHDTHPSFAELRHQTIVGDRIGHE